MSYAKINTDILRTLQAPGLAYYGALGFVLLVLTFGAYAFAQQWQFGLGVAGYEHPTLWSIYITNFVFWIGIAHSGTLDGGRARVGNHDRLCSHDSGVVSDHPHRPTVGFLLANPVSQ